jgi:hypothetical protein
MLDLIIMTVISAASDIILHICLSKAMAPIVDELPRATSNLSKIRRN